MWFYIAVDLFLRCCEFSRKVGIGEIVFVEREVNGEIQSASSEWYVSYEIAKAYEIYLRCGLIMRGDSLDSKCVRRDW